MLPILRKKAETISEKEEMNRSEMEYLPCMAVVRDVPGRGYLGNSHEAIAISKEAIETTMEPNKRKEAKNNETN